MTRGQPLVELSNAELELEVLDREGRLIESITQLQAYETQLEQNPIANQKSLAQIDYDIVRLKRSLARRNQLVARAPVTGRLTEMDLEVGENRNRGERFAQITPDTGFKLAAEVDEFYLQRVRDGQVAQVDIGDQSFEVQVTRVYPEVKDGTFKVDLTFQAAQPAGLIPGQAVQGRLSLGADRLTTILAAGAFLERTGGDWVFVVGPDGHSARRRTIKLGRRNAEQVEIAADRAVGERVIVSDYTGLTPGMPSGPSSSWTAGW